ncbi:hypothetical protein [Paraliobacillus ryukyuensis]|uniref:hypothetical protein n=1 Tax=Paraliobacillus ryukyuensis TaxID=200904 RepID=UPI0009A8071C|nr:hypothetical protein [Paraliobacillus ryukyuensis]
MLKIYGKKVKYTYKEMDQRSHLTMGGWAGMISYNPETELLNKISDPEKYIEKKEEFVEYIYLNKLNYVNEKWKDYNIIKYEGKEYSVEKKSFNIDDNVEEIYIDYIVGDYEDRQKEKLIKDIKDASVAKLREKLHDLEWENYEQRKEIRELRETVHDLNENQNVRDSNKNQKKKEKGIFKFK